MGHWTAAPFQPSQVARETPTFYRSSVVLCRPGKEVFVYEPEPCKFALAQARNANVCRRAEEDDQAEGVFEFFVPSHDRTCDNRSLLKSQLLPQQGSAFLRLSLVLERRASVLSRW
jgi:hypothetical protein